MGKLACIPHQVFPVRNRKIETRVAHLVGLDLLAPSSDGRDRRLMHVYTAPVFSVRRKQKVVWRTSLAWTSLLLRRMAAMAPSMRAARSRASPTTVTFSDSRSFVTPTARGTTLWEGRQGRRGG
jgi:hypothetical protein